MTARTICAVATPPGRGGVGIVRVSGPAAEAILRAVCPDFPPGARSHHLRLCRAVDAEGELLDEVLAVVMRGPHSFTGEDVAELQGHGGPLNMSRLLGALCAAGASPAAPGEFTQRAFLNGRIDLTQAEAVADLIEASSDAALRLARRHLAGRLGDEIEGLREALAEAVALTEAAIDFSTEEHVYQLDAEAMRERIVEVEARVGALLGTWEAGRQAREGIRVVILGRPNAGKSTLFNLLCGQQRAIVTEHPGTTRDFIEEPVVVGQVALRLVDTAGLRRSDDAVEQIGVQRAVEQAKCADLVLWVVDAAEPFDPDPREVELLEGASDMDVLPILNKVDLPLALDEAALDRIAAIAGRPAERVSLAGTSSPTALLERVEAIASARLRPAEEGAAIARHRHRDALMRASEALSRAREAVEAQMSHEFVALDLRLALEAVGEIVGRVTVDDLLRRIFSEFCVGK